MPEDGRSREAFTAHVVAENDMTLDAGRPREQSGEFVLNSVGNASGIKSILVLVGMTKTPG